MLPHILINNCYLIGEKIGSGSFGEIYYGIHKKDKTPVAIKLESIESHTKLLSHEHKVYQHILSDNDIPGFPKIMWYGTKDDYHVLVMSYLGPNLESIFKKNNNIFSLKTVLAIMDQALYRIEHVHDTGYIHRDLKPENFVIGHTDPNQIYLIDYGLSKKNYELFHYRKNRKLVGTARYASINSHRGLELSRRDDLESLGYIMIYFLKGSLPWQGLKGNNREEKYHRILKIKENTTVSDLCKGLPSGIQRYFEHIKSLDFIEKPNYSYLHRLILYIFKRHNINNDLKFEWKL
jgi:serine/threonine protein kinase